MWQGDGKGGYERDLGGKHLRVYQVTDSGDWLIMVDGAVRGSDEERPKAMLRAERLARQEMPPTPRIPEMPAKPDSDSEVPA
jgi:hypothetical protein